MRRPDTVDLSIQITQSGQKTPLDRIPHVDIQLGRHSGERRDDEVVIFDGLNHRIAAIDTPRLTIDVARLVRCEKHCNVRYFGRSDPPFYGHRILKVLLERL